MPDRRYRVLAVATHPVQYMTPIFRRMAEHPLLDFQVAYCSLRGAEAGHDPEFGADIQWDVPLLDGYSWTHVPNRGSAAESMTRSSVSSVTFAPRFGWRYLRRNFQRALSSSARTPLLLRHAMAAPGRRRSRKSSGPGYSALPIKCSSLL